MIVIFAAIISMIMIISIASVGGHFSERSGVINLSIEAFMTIGAIAYSLMAGQHSLRNSLGHQFWIMPMAGIAAAAFSVIYALITVKLKANQTIAGIALNILALAISVYIIHSKANPEGISDTIKLQNSLFSLAKSNDKAGWLFNITLFIGIPLLVGAWILMNKTRFGNRIKACGEQPHAAASLGINVERVQMRAILISGFISGVAGAMFAQGMGSIFRGSTQGIGFLAVAIVIFGQWRTSLIIISAVLFGTLYGMAQQKILISAFDSIPKEIFQMIPFLLSLIVLIGTQKNSKVPKALGIPYRNVGR